MFTIRCHGAVYSIWFHITFIECHGIESSFGPSLLGSVNSGVGGFRMMLAPVHHDAVVRRQHQSTRKYQSLSACQSICPSTLQQLRYYSIDTVALWCLLLILPCGRCQGRKKVEI